MDNLDNEQLKEFLKRHKKGEIDPLISEEVTNIFQEKTISSTEKETRLARLSEQIQHKLVPESQVVFIHRRRNSSFIWAAAAVIILITAAGLWMNSHNVFKSGTEQLAEAKPLVFTGKQLVKLADGSTALLNENSELTIPPSFGKSSRGVSLKGEAYFDVAHDPSKPFKVFTGKVVTEVLGTAFNINANSEKNIIVTVTRGKVAVGDKDHSYSTLIPNEQIAVNTSNNEFVKSRVDSAKATAWKENYFIVDNVTLAQAVILIEKRFNVKVTITNDSLKDCIVNAWFFNNENLKQVVEGISAIQQATAIIDGESVTIEGGIGCKPSH
jgi:transmembrane sensor